MLLWTKNLSVTCPGSSCLGSVARLESMPARADSSEGSMGLDFPGGLVTSMLSPRELVVEAGFCPDAQMCLSTTVVSDFLHVQTGFLQSKRRKRTRQKLQWAFGT